MCSKSFFETRFLKQHYSYVHQGLKIFKCDYNQCDKSFATQHGLSGHIGKTRYYLFWIMHPTTKVVGFVIQKRCPKIV